MEDILGTIRMFANKDWNIRGYLPCDGRLLQVINYQGLFAILGSVYGGDGQTTFALPKLEAPAGRYLMCVRGLFPDRE